VVADLLADAARRPAAITFDREYVLSLGGVEVRMAVVGPTHTLGDTGFFVTGDNVLFSGDVVMNERARPSPRRRDRRGSRHRVGANSTAYSAAFIGGQSVLANHGTTGTLEYGIHDQG